MSEKEFGAKREELPNVFTFIENELKKLTSDSKIINQFHLIAEEIFVNIVDYAYKFKEPGTCKIKIDYEKDLQEVRLIFEDNGMEFNPLEKEEPDTSLSADERPIGGLGIMLVKKNIDNIEYKYENKKNILILIKKMKGFNYEG